MAQYKHKCGVGGGQDLVYKDMEGMCSKVLLVVDLYNVVLYL